MAIFSPSGGKLRDKLLGLIQTNSLNNLLEIEPLRNIRKEIETGLENKKAIYRINQTDFSQERAIMGAFMDNCVIWGPPGTGKSQTITNIIANIMVQKKTAIVASQKKAALDVIQKRMGKLAKYMFFGLTDKETNRHDFYQPFNDLIDKVIEAKDVAENKPRTLHSQENWDFIAQNKELATVEIDKILKFNQLLEEHSIEQKDLENFLPIINKYAEVIKKLDPKVSLEENFTKNGILKKGFFRKKYSEDIEKLSDFLNRFDRKFELSKTIVTTKNYQELFHLERLKEVEENYVKQRSQFHNDIDYIDELMSLRFRKRIRFLQHSEKYKKKVSEFIKNIKSRHRLPYKFVVIHQEIISLLFEIFVSTPQTLASVVDLDQAYDFAIFDEASQLHLEKAIPFLSVAKLSIVAGDNQQMRPASDFQIRDNSESFDDYSESAESLLDFAYGEGLKAREYMLTKNYRSKAAELMLFSSKEFYESNLDVVDDLDYINREVIEVFEVNGKWEKNANLLEATLVLEKLLELQNKYEKIIILALNAAQRKAIDNLISFDARFTQLAELLKAEKVALRNLENIQGDEADLVIVSVAYDKDARLYSTYVGRNGGQNALNVEISRAIKKMIVYKSLKAVDVKLTSHSSDLRIFKNWLQYLEKTYEERKGYLLTSNRHAETFDSGFEVDVFDELKKHPFPKEMILTTQFPVGSYSIDIALLDKKTTKFLLGIEVDGYAFHSGFAKITADNERQSFIEAKGFPITRITEIQWKAERTQVIKRIQGILRQLY